jgi:hypothetical protein
MSGIVPVSVPENFTPKGFFKRPEGKPGFLMLLGLIGVTGFYVWGKVVPFVLSTIANTFWLGVYIAAGLAIADVLFGLEPVGKSLRTTGINIFKSLARAAAWTYTTIDPIGILENTYDEMVKERGVLGDAVEKFTSTDQSISNKIDKDSQDAQKFGGMANEAKHRAAAAADALTRQKWEIEAETNFTKAGLLMGSVEKYKKLQANIKSTLHTFQSWCQIADGKISKTSFIIDYAKEEHKAMVAINRTVAIGKRLLRGDDDQQKLWNMSMEYLAEEAATTVGQMREFTRYTDRLLNESDLENAAAADAASQQFNDFNNKLLAAKQEPSYIDMIQIPGSQARQPAYAAARVTVASSADADDFFNN